MWNMITHFLTFTGGMSAGVVLMCLLQTGKQADEEFEYAMIFTHEPMLIDHLIFPSPN